MNKQQRTDAILARTRGKPEEFYRLHGILCMDYGWDNRSSLALMELFDGVRLAERLDEITRNTVAEIQRAERLEAAERREQLRTGQRP